MPSRQDDHIIGHAVATLPFSCRLLALGAMPAGSCHQKRYGIGPHSLCDARRSRLIEYQPFVRELRGRVHVFAHNGQLGEGIVPDNINRRRFRPIGETDSEGAFCLLMERLAADVDRKH